MKQNVTWFYFNFSKKNFDFWFFLNTMKIYLINIFDYTFIAFSSNYTLF